MAVTAAVCAGRGRGVGSQIVRALQERVLPGERVCLVTLESTQDFYEQLGFTVIEERKEIPR